MMNTKQLRFLLTIFLITGASFSSMAQSTSAEPWTPNQLMPPADLAKVITDKNAPQPIVFSIGPDAIIKGSIDIGSAQEKANLAKLKERLSKLPKDANIVIYCGC